MEKVGKFFWNVMAWVGIVTTVGIILTVAGVAGIFAIFND